MSDENHVSPDMPLTIEIDEEKPMVPMTPSDDSEPLSSPGFHSADIIDGDVKMIEDTVAAAVASDKIKLRQLSNFLEKWVSQNSNNLYPTRQEKEQLAMKMGMTYIQVNRWFANRRRKVTKRTRVVPSPASITPVENEALAAQQSGTSLSKDDEMVMQNSQTPAPLTPPHDHDDPLAFMPPSINNPHFVPEAYPHDLVAELAALQKILAALPQYNPAVLVPALLPALGINPLTLFNAQMQVINQQIAQHQLQQQLLAHQQQQQERAQMIWMAGSISASPAHHSDSEISEMSELSPLPMSAQQPRPHSPFKDPHGIADTDMLALMSLSKLSEREQQAVNILLELGADVR